MYAIPYTPEIHGEITNYLKEYDGSMTDNLFLGYTWFEKMRDSDILMPNCTLIRVAYNHTPDICYTVTDSFKLHGLDTQNWNMSAVPAQPGEYEPRPILERKLWSIHGVNIQF